MSPAHPLRRAAWRVLRPDTIRAYEQSAGDGRGDPAAVDAGARRRVRAAIADAARHVPFYREHWGGRGILAAAEKGDLALEDLPLLTRELLRAGFAALRRQGGAAGRVIDRSTGGSSGEPVRFLQEWGYLERAAGRGLRILTWGGWELGARTAMVWGGPNELKLHEGIRGRLKAALTNRRIYDAFRTGDDVYARWVADWREWRPEFVLAYPSAVEGVASWMLARGERVEGVRAVFTTAEKLYPKQRETIARAFGAPVRDQYGSREVQSVAAECTHGRMHAYQDSAYVELLPATSGAPGGAGRVVVTQVDNRVMPLIRYENGDLASWRAESGACPCGLAYPALAEIAGRTSDLFRFRDGRVVHGEYFTHIMYDVRGVKAFQFYQAPDASVTLFVVPDSGNGNTAYGSREELERVLGEAVRRLPEHLDTSFDIAVRVVPEIPKRGQGKHRFTLSEYSGA